MKSNLVAIQSTSITANPSSMPLPIDISALLAGSLVESERIELKEGWNPESVLHTLCAFANDFHNLGGGYVIIGVAEKDGHAQMPPVGLDPQRIDAIQKEILNLGHSAIQPFYHPVMEPVVIDGKHILILWAPGGPARPYKAWVTLGKTNTEWAYYIRKGSSSVRAKGSDERELLGLANNIPFDDRVNHRATLADLDLGLIRTFLRAIGSELYKTSAKMEFEALCRQMQIVDGPPEAMFPRNVGLLFFKRGTPPVLSAGPDRCRLFPRRRWRRSLRGKNLPRPTRPHAARVAGVHPISLPR